MHPRPHRRRRPRLSVTPSLPPSLHLLALYLQERSQADIDRTRLETALSEAAQERDAAVEREREARERETEALVARERMEIELTGVERELAHIRTDSAALLEENARACEEARGLRNTLGCVEEERTLVELEATGLRSELDAAHSIVGRLEGELELARTDARVTVEACQEEARKLQTALDEVSLSLSLSLSLFLSLGCSLARARALSLSLPPSLFSLSLSSSVFAFSLSGVCFLFLHSPSPRLFLSAAHHDSDGMHTHTHTHTHTHKQATSAREQLREEITTSRHEKTLLLDAAGLHVCVYVCVCVCVCVCVHSVARRCRSPCLKVDVCSRPPARPPAHSTACPLMRLHARPLLHTPARTNARTCAHT